MAATLPELHPAPPHAGGTVHSATRASDVPGVLRPWLRAQSINVTRHAAALRPFRREEFGPGAAAPSEGHIQVVNRLISTLRDGMLKMSRRITNTIDAASEEPSSPTLQQVVVHKDQ